MAIKLIDRPLPLNAVQRKTRLTALTTENGASIRTAESVMTTLKRMSLLPEYVENVQDDAKSDSRIVKTAEEITAKAGFNNSKNVISAEDPLDTAEKTEILQETALEKSVVPTAPAQPLQKTTEDTEKLRKIAENSEKLQKNVQETAPQGNALVLPSEVVEALKQVHVLSEKFSSLPQMMKQGFNEYVKDIAKASEEQEVGRTEKMTINEGSSIVRTVYLTEDDDVLRLFEGEGLRGSLSEFRVLH